MTITPKEVKYEFLSAIFLNFVFHQPSTTSGLQVRAPICNQRIVVWTRQMIMRRLKTINN